MINSFFFLFFSLSRQQMEKMVFKAFTKSQFEDQELDENCNIAKQQHQLETNESNEKRKSNFDAFNLFRFKRRATRNNSEIVNQINKEQQHANLQASQQSDYTNTTSSLKTNPSSSNLLNAKPLLDRNHSNLSTSSIRSSKYSLTRRDLNKKHTIKKKDLKTATSRIKKISSIKGDNQILQNIIGKVNSNSKTNLYEPLTEQQYLKYLHPDGRIKCLRELRLAIYKRGIESSLRSTLWKHLLNVYPPNMTSEQRVRFVQMKSDQYYQLCFTWQRNFSHPKVQQVYNQVRKGK